MAVENGGSGTSSGLAVLGGAAGAVVLVVVGYLIFQSVQGDDPVPVEVAEPAPVAEPVPAPEVTEAAPEPAEPAAPVAPEFDVVRVDPNGEALVAGRAQPGAPVSIMVDGEEVASVEANASGEFVAMFSMQGDGGPKVMTLNAGGEEGVASAENVIVTPAAPLVPEADTPAEPVETAEAAPTATEVGEPETPVETAEADAPAEDPVAPQVLLADESGITVLQDAGNTPLEVMEVISLDTIAYDEEGTVELAGRGREDRQVLVYLNNALIRTVRVGEGGQWRAPLPDVATGVYTLRVDEVDEDGTVTSRSETPFKREEPDALVAAAVSGGDEAPGRPPIERITVQPGSTLWAIAREKYGEGIMYVEVFDANRDRIRNPDLIYPGQVFELPDQ